MGAAKMVLMLASVLGAEDVTLVQFSAGWCDHCQKMRSTVRRLEADGYPLRHVDVDQQKEMINTHRVRALPTFILMRDGVELKRIEGEVSYAQLAQMVEATGFRRPQRPTAAGAQADRETIIRAQSPNAGRPKGLLSSALERLTGKPSDRTAQPTSTGPTSTGPTSTGPTSTGPTSTGPTSTGPTRAAMRAPEQASPEQLALRASVKLRIEDETGYSFGSGTIIDTHGEDALVLTCGHIFRESAGKGAIEVQIHTPNGAKTVQGNLIAWEPDYRDIGLVAIRPGAFVTAAAVASSANFRPNDPVFSIGCDHGADPTMRRGRITSLDRFEGSPNIEVTGKPTLGRSGGGLFNSAGQVIGVCKLANPADDEGIYASIKSVHFHLDKVGLSQVYSARPAPSHPVAESPVAESPVARSPVARSPVAKSPVADSPVGRQTAPPQPTAASLASASATRGEPNVARAANLTQVGNVRAPARAIAQAIQNRSADTEVIVIMRPRNEPNGLSEVLIVDDASDELIESIRRAVGRSRLGANASVAANARPSPMPNIDRGARLMRGQSER